MEKLLEFKCRKSRPPRVICSLMESGEKSQASSAQLSAANSCTLSKAPLATALHYCDITHRSLNLMISCFLKSSEAKGSPGQVTAAPTVPEGVGLHILTGVGVALGNERHRHSQPSPFQHQVLCREARVPPVHTEGEGQVLPVTQNLVAQELA